jgi:hypothetical protein
MTGLQWVRSALVTLEVLDPTETPTAQEAADALDIGNDWIDALALKGFALYYLLRTVVPLTGASSYTIGVGGTINIARPVEIDHAGLIIDTSASPLSEIPIDVFTDQQWEGIVQKGYSAATYPQGIRYDYNWAAGLATITPWPIPTSTTMSLVLYTPSALTEMTLAGNVTFPPGYRRLLKYGLARELSASGFGGWTGEKEQRYINAYSDVEARNLRMSDLHVGGRGRSNIYTGAV